jgi:LmbE family N-acetylglucosaminyl deacetylase
MLSLILPSHQPANILCLGAHCDDIEIGCGGTLIMMLRASVDVCVRWVVFCADAARAREARSSARNFLNGAREKKVTLLDYRDGFLPYLGSQVKEEFEKLKCEIRPDLIFTHYRDDLHQDHRLISDLTWNTWRDHFILEYEIPKYDGDLGAPNLFVPLQKRVFKRKVEAIVRAFQSQQRKQWFEKATFHGLARLRGMECNSPTGLAEAFFCRKAVWAMAAGTKKKS